MLLFCLFFSLTTHAVSVADAFPSFLEQAKSAHYSTHLHVENIDVDELTHTEYHSGIAYGAIATQLVDISYTGFNEYLNRPGSLLQFLKSVKTQTNVVAVNEAPREVTVRLEIKVPVVANFHTQDDVVTRELANGRLVEWRQVGADGDLVYNQGMVIISPADNQTRIYVVGIYIIKAERKVPWIGRPIATRFTRDHYSNYITTLESLVRH